MMKIRELRIDVKKLDFVALPGTNPGGGTAEFIPLVVFLRVVTDRLLVSDEGVRVLGVGR